MIDLHLHLDGSLSPQLARELAEMDQVPLPEHLEAALRAPENCQSLNDYLGCFELPVALLQTARALNYAAYSLCCRLADQGLLYGEIRFAPQLHTRLGLSQYRAAEAVCLGLARARRERPQFRAQAILCCMRGAEPDANRLTIQLARELLGKGVCGADLAGAEALFPTQSYEELFATAAELGVPFTIHAGEAAGPESIRAALGFGARRIGHGVRALEDPALVLELAARQIPLELCFTSNLQTKAVAGAEAFPLREFLHRGLAVTVNTDNMTVSGTTLQREYQKLLITPEELDILMENAVKAAFLDSKGKRALLLGINQPENRRRWQEAQTERSD